jgi:hypothetical protein
MIVLQAAPTVVVDNKNCKAQTQHSGFFNPSFWFFFFLIGFSVYSGFWRLEAEKLMAEFQQGSL